MQKLTEKDITNMLIKQHGKKYLCVPQCKTEPTAWDVFPAIMDLWCMDNAAGSPTFIAYEIKTSRADFLSDIRSKKWKRYLPYCNEFYFVLSNLSVGYIPDLPEGVGLKVVTRKGDSIRTIWQSNRHIIDFPASVMHYVLLKRAAIIDRRAK